MESVRRIVVSPNTFGLKINGRNIRPLMVHANAVAREDGCPTTLFYIHALVDHQEFHDAMAHEAATIFQRVQEVLS